MDARLLYKYFEGFTTQDEEEAIRVWLEKSPENKKIFLENRRIYDAVTLNSKDHKTETEDIYDEKRNEGNKSRKVLYIQSFLKIAAAVLITFLCSWYFFSKNEPESKFVAYQTINVPPGQRINIELPDGTNVWLNAKTTLKYPVSFNSQERVIELDGQAYFDVVKNEHAPFIVKSANGQVRALGTKFDVMDYSDNEVFETMLMEGSVKVDLNNTSQSLILTPNNKAFLRNGNLESIEVYDLSSYLWKDGLISFRNETFENIMKLFERTYDINIVIEKENLKNLSFTGKFRMTDGVEYALRILQKEINFKFKRNTENHTIYIK